MREANKPEKRIVITGGHLTPAFAVVECLKRSGWEIYWFGEKRAVSGKEVKTLEYKVIPKHGIPFYSVTSAKFQRSTRFKSLLFFWKIPIGFFQSLSLLNKIKPRVVLSFGGYLSVPVVVASWILRIPVVLHEQTAAPGLANQLVARFATKVAISFPGSGAVFPSNKIVLTGNPIRKNIFEIAKKRKSERRGKLPVLYITGGSRGSQVINKAILETLPKLLNIFTIYHQAGDLDFPSVLTIYNKLPEKLKKRYNIAANYSFSEVERIFGEVDIAVSRAGANSVLEFAALGIPSILVPLPHAGFGEQEANARALVATGLAIILPQNKLTGRLLFVKLKDMLTGIGELKAHAKEALKLVKEDAAERILELVEEQWRKV